MRKEYSWAWSQFQDELGEYAQLFPWRANLCTAELLASATVPYRNGVLTRQCAGDDRTGQCGSETRQLEERLRHLVAARTVRGRLERGIDRSQTKALRSEQELQAQYYTILLFCTSTIAL